ncbi:hypothetical protein LINGRAHAP2_LOCUS2547, partial [Linum grandiflorum]
LISTVVALPLTKICRTTLPEVFGECLLSTSSLFRTVELHHQGFAECLLSTSSHASNAITENSFEQQSSIYA